jgi:predicted Zn finger-like uncharacterized protein
MPIQAVCPACRAAYQLAEQQRGKKVRCKQCDAVFVVAEVSARPTAVRRDTSVTRPATPARANAPRSAAPRPAPARAKRAEDDDVVEARGTKSGSNPLPWILGCAMIGGGLLLLLGGGGTLAYFMLRDKPAEVANKDSSVPPQNAPPKAEQPFNAPPAVKIPPPGQLAENIPVQGQPVPPPTNPPPAKDPAPPPAVEDKPSDPPPARDNNRRLSGEGRDRVKRATVYLRVTMPDGSKASGTGFFGSKEARNIILTNAHVVGMLSPESSRPQAIEVFVNSGQDDEWKTTARVLGVDRSSDLAVLDIGTPPRPVPEPLTVKSASVLRELDEVYVFGFPFGEQLGKEITIRPSSVSSLRKKGGVLDRVQVNGGMDPGNSGGPVVDNSGDVVGVAVSGIPGRAINFAIPGERIHVVLDGRISGLSFHQPYFADDNTVVVPTVVDMIDPRNLIKEVGLDVWTGNAPPDPKSAHRPPAVAQPEPKPGDSPHLYFKLTYLAPEGKADLKLPELPPGKVYWQQPKWINAKGQTHWASANLLRLPTEPVSRKPANLVLRYPQGATRDVDLTIDNTFKTSSDDDSETFRIHTVAGFREKVEATGADGSRLTLRYRVPPKRDLIEPGGKSRPSGLLQQIKNDLPKMITTVQVDRLGNIRQQFIDQRPLLPLRRTNPQQIQLLNGFHEMIQHGLESLSVSLPASGTAKPLESWRAERQLPIDTPGKSELGKLDVTFTYLGVRKRNNRDEAVISMDGLVRGKSDAINGKATGRVLVDLATGQTVLAETTVKLQLDALLSEPGEGARKLRVMATIQFRMQRKL